MAAALALAALLARCAPAVGAVTMRAVVQRESGTHPYAIRDDATGRAFYPAGADAAVALARRLALAGSDLDLGYMQINARNLRAFGVDVRAAFDPCTNLRIGARILADDYRRAASAYGPGQPALVRALSAYHSGRFDEDAYPRSVYATARRLRAAAARRLSADVVARPAP